MSTESDDVFTLEDAENDGLIKVECGKKLKRVLSRESPEVYKHLLNVAENNNRQVEDMLGDMVVRAINSDEYRNQVLSTQVNIEKLNKTEMRKEDLDMVIEMMDKVGVNNEGKEDPIDKLIERRINAMGGGPMGMLEGGEGSAREKQLERRINRLESQLQQERSGAQQQPQESQPQQEVEPQPAPEPKNKPSNKEVDDLLDRGSSNEQESDENRGGQPVPMSTEEAEE